MMEVVRVSSKGQVVIPKRVREKMGIKEGEYLLLVQEGDIIVMKKLDVNLEAVFREGETLAKKQGITVEDVKRAIKEVRYGK
ncbi:AbrB/MazE/SpoVT family DNA-binding domain-containing protein [Thermococcus waiotapuensis]|uniref:AbrB/MazE/SpoVT family DNA-binding domain-containing protein n=1 Tax=Thermococcus waiotapuensis TaxID=90909 RepID=A0AAE4NUZ4_9EURY|nr:AbrB/MazE/SpoVT family DNA-binding domain-containing protein [Thermococcus waiotapuensis]MDV3104065.1 AbrB/MazE/SpoVT family DNA-binding domain-containing protein [Thermococcus waiotapuensis]